MLPNILACSKTLSSEGRWFGAFTTVDGDSGVDSDDVGAVASLEHTLSPPPTPDVPPPSLVDDDARRRSSLLQTSKRLIKNYNAIKVHTIQYQIKLCKNVRNAMLVTPSFSAIVYVFCGYVGNFNTRQFLFLLTSWLLHSLRTTTT